MSYVPYPRAQHYSEYGKCCRCKKNPATCDLMSFINEHIGKMCVPCAKKSIKEAHRKEQFLPDMCV